MLKITIITVTYNSEKYLEDCINSILKQTYKKIEFIIIDGSSTDKTINIIKKYNSKISKWISEPDNGIYDAINKGINLSSGEIIGILNSDDIFADENVLKRIAKKFENPATSAIFSDITFSPRDDMSKIVRYYSSKFFRLWMFKFGFQPAHPTFYVKKEIFNKYGLYRTDLKIAGDFELMLRFLLKNKVKYKYVDDMWVKMRMGGVSTSGISSIIKLNNQVIDAHKYNDLYTNKIFVYSKYLVKWWGFIKK